MTFGYWIGMAADRDLTFGAFLLNKGEIKPRHEQWAAYTGTPEELAEYLGVNIREIRYGNIIYTNVSPPQ